MSTNRKTKRHARGSTLNIVEKNFLATTELFIESGNVYIETKRNVDRYIAFLCIPAWSYGGKIKISTNKLLVLTVQD
jgi:hypothetical protein